MERTNARNMQPDWFSESLEFASIDVSFISLRLILPPLSDCLRTGARVVALIKPQFEAGRSEVGKHGVVRDPAVHSSVCAAVLEHARIAGYDIKGLSFSPITGPKGNIEFLALLEKSASKEGITTFSDDTIGNIVHTAHEFLDR